MPLQVVGSQARILYSNEEGRIAIAVAFNKAVAEGRLKVSLRHPKEFPVFSFLLKYNKPPKCLALLIFSPGAGGDW